MGREHEDQHIYLYVCINPVAVFGKEKKKPQYFKASMYSSLDYTTEKKMLTPFLPLWAMLVSHPWSLIRLGSQVWSVEGLVRMC